MRGTALILAAHGAGDASAANGTIRKLARRLRATRLFDEVTPAFRLGTPAFGEVLDRIDSTRVVVVPVMAGDGYFAGVVLPRDLNDNARIGEVDLHITAPVGTHPDLVEIVAARARSTLDAFKIDAADSALIVVGHGTMRHSRSRAACIRVRDVLRKRAVCAHVEAAFLDEEPFVEDMPDRLPHGNLIAVPFLIGGGLHATRDIPRRLGLASTMGDSPLVWGRVNGRRIICTDALGNDRGLVDVIKNLATQCAFLETATC